MTIESPTTDKPQGRRWSLVWAGVSLALLLGVLSVFALLHGVDALRAKRAVDGIILAFLGGLGAVVAVFIVSVVWDASSFEKGDTYDI